MLADFLADQIRSGKTLLISGGTGTGKTTLLRILTDFIPEQDRLVVIEDTSELQIQKPNILPTVVRCTPALIIRKFTRRHYTIDDLIWRNPFRSA